jgi:hypothetical protein
LSALGLTIFFTVFSSSVNADSSCSGNGLFINCQDCCCHYENGDPYCCICNPVLWNILLIVFGIIVIIAVAAACGRGRPRAQPEPEPERAIVAYDAVLAIRRVIIIAGNYVAFMQQAILVRLHRRPPID